MSTQVNVLDRYDEVTEDILRHAEPADVAQHQYGFDPEAAKRLAFFVWLYATGRLSDC